MEEDSDHELALLLQLEYDTEMDLQTNLDDENDDYDCKTLSDLEKSITSNMFDLMPETPSPKKNSMRKVYTKSSSKKMSIIDPQWELLDPVPNIHDLFLQYNATFFWEKLASAEVRWSPRMTLCAGLCVYERRGGFCSIRLSVPLLKLRPRKDLVETLLHEMIHAFLFLTNNNKDHDDHGPEFQKHMKRINDSEGTNISIYHSFHDEVDSYRQHWWRCDGPCRCKKPFFGWVKRAMNRAPSSRDPWWADHQRTCGGTYVKVKEPEGYKNKGKKNKMSKDTSTSWSDSKQNPGSSNDSKDLQKNKREKNIPNDTGMIFGNEIKGPSFDFKFSKGASTTVLATSSVHAFTGPGSKLGGTLEGKPASGCHASRLLTPFSQSSNTSKPTDEKITQKIDTYSANRGQKRLSDEYDQSKNSNKLRTEKRPGTSGAISGKPREMIVDSILAKSVIDSKKESSPRKNDIRNFFTIPRRHKPDDCVSKANVSPDPERVPCPVCGHVVDFPAINDHLNSCLNT